MSNDVSKNSIKNNIIATSGCQSGVDLAALEIARDFGFKTGGIVPYKAHNEDGYNEELIKLYNLNPFKDETLQLSEQYRRRTRYNIRGSDISIVFSLFDSPGTRLSIKLLNMFNKDYFIINEYTDDVSYMTDYIKKEAMKGEIRLNFIGHRRSKLSDEQYNFVIKTLNDILCNLE